MSKPRVLFICTGNTARSQMAEAFLRAHAWEHFDVFSAGIEPKDNILPEVLEVMDERGINMDGQVPKGVDTYLGKLHFSHVITVCGEAEKNCPTIFLNMGVHDHWPFDDPAKFKGNHQQRIEFTRALRDRIEHRVQTWLAGLGIQSGQK